MKIEKETSWTKKQRKDSSTKKFQKRDKDSNVTANKECADSSETNVSVFRKSTNPKILIST